VGSWGSDAGIRRVARLADGWLASAYNISPPDFAAAWTRLRDALDQRGRDASSFPNALSTMWFHITDDPAEADAIYKRRLAPTIHRPEEQLRERLPVGPAEHVAEKLLAFAEAGVQRVYLWPVTDEITQIQRVAEEVVPLVA
jgi:alkanesulfonate monooxygenase SsuD/methylene tetrahydromethanopterin reductase-like flavin-dependent oxidoreductase (luciferase family)